MLVYSGSRSVDTSSLLVRRSCVKYVCKVVSCVKVLFSLSLQNLDRSANSSFILQIYIL